MSAAEANLDDFFRKRDKKKKSSKTTKFSKIDNAELASHLDAVSSTVALIEDEQQVDTDVPSSILAPSAVVVAPSSDLTTNITSTKIITKTEDDGDDEWKQFETDENRNYSGLKINFLRYPNKH